MYQSIPLMELVDKLSKLFCTPSFPPTLSFCANMLFVIAGYNQYEIELDTVRCEFVYFVYLRLEIITEYLITFGRKYITANKYNAIYSLCAINVIGKVSSV